MTPAGDRRPARLTAAIVAASLLATVAPASPAGAETPWVLDPARSRLAFVATQAGGEFEGRFMRFGADIVFEPGNPQGSRFRVTIDTSSAATGDETRDQALAGDDFFASARWPTATYDATRFRPVPGGRYEALGRLTIRGISRDVGVQFTFTPSTDGRSAVLAGGTTIRRLDFDVGQGEWQDTKWVGNDVRIEFDLALQQAPARAND